MLRTSAFFRKTFHEHKHFSSAALLIPMTLLFHNISLSEQAEHKKKLCGKDIFFVNNSLLYAVGPTIKKNQETGELPPVVVVVPYWLDKANRDYDDELWGQTPFGIPMLARNVFFELYPNFPQNNFLTWKNVKELRDFQMQKLKKMHDIGEITLIDLRNEDISTYESGKLLELKNKDGQLLLKVNSGDKKVEHILASIDSTDRIFNYLSLPNKLPNLLAHEGFEAKPHTTLYQFPKKEIPSKLLVHGVGLSTVWLQKHFPDSLIVAVKKDNRNIELPKIPSNQTVDYNAIQMVPVDNLRLLNGDSENIYVKLDGGEILAFNKKTEMFTAIGYHSYNKLTDSLILEGLQADKIKTYRGFDEKKWVAPKNIPPGSLTHHLLGFYYQAEFYNDLSEVWYEFQFYIDDITPTALQRKCLKENISLNRVFFDNLELKIKELDNPLTTEKAEMKFYCDIFEIQSPSEIEMKKFQTIIQEIQRELKSQYQYKNKKEIEVEDSNSAVNFKKPR